LKAIALIIALVLLYYRPRNQKGTGWYRSYVNWLHRVFNPNSSRQGIIAWLMAVGLPALLMINVYFLILFKFGLLAALLVNIVVLYFVLQFSNFGLETENIYQELSAEKLDDARLSYTAWQNKPMEEYSKSQLASLTIEATVLRAYHGLFAPILWFVLLGSAGAVLYRASEQLQRAWPDSSNQPLHQFAQKIHQWIDWLPVRFTAICFAIVGDFEDAAYCWRNQAAQWTNRSLGILLTSAAGALDIRLADTLPDHDKEIERAEAGIGDDPGADEIYATLAMVRRVLLLLIGLVLLLFFGYWLGS
jgi:adenosylcobinamide-phosphate synthase